MTTWVMLVALFGPGQWDASFHRPNHQFDSQFECEMSGITLAHENFGRGQDTWFTCVRSKGKPA